MSSTGPKKIEFASAVTVRDLATGLSVSPIDIIKQLMSNGMMATINQRLDFETIEMVAPEFDYGVRQAEDEVADFAEEGDPEETLVPRPPVVTIMGHVDHGKTSLLCSGWGRRLISISSFNS